MILAAWRDGTYDVVLFLHIVAVLIAFAPVLLNPMLEAYLRKTDGERVVRDWSAFNVEYTKVFSLGALVAVLVTGILMIVLSDEAIEFSETWISLSFLVWLAIGGVLSAMVLKGQKMLAAGDPDGRKRAMLGNQITTALLLIALYLMIFKPGSPLP